MIEYSGKAARIKLAFKIAVINLFKLLAYFAGVTDQLWSMVSLQAGSFARYYLSFTNTKLFNIILSVKVAQLSH